jgi:hypothetical protein
MIKPERSLQSTRFYCRYRYRLEALQRRETSICKAPQSCGLLTSVAPLIAAYRASRYFAVPLLLVDVESLVG